MQAPAAGNTADSLRPIPATELAAKGHHIAPTSTAAGLALHDALQAALDATERDLAVSQANDLAATVIAKGEADAEAVSVTSADSALAARVADLEARLENFNRRSGQKI